MRVLVAAGGTGGHLFPAVSVIEELKKNAANQIFLLTSSKGKGGKIIKELNIKGGMLSMRGMPRNVTGNWLAFFKELFAAFKTTKKVFKEFSPQIVIAHGGYVTFCALTLAKRRGIPFCLQEQNVILGLTNRIFRRGAKRIFTAFPSANLPEAIDCGNPVRESITEHEPQTSRYALGLHPHKFTLLISGGSQGAKKINQAFTEAWHELAERDNIQAVWSAGEMHFKKLSNSIAPSSRVKIFPFIKRMGQAYAAADLVISRAGATTISELNACGKPAILIPYPYAANNHQQKNAELQLEKGAALLIAEKDLTASKLTQVILSLAEDKERLEQMAQNSLQLKKTSAASVIVAEMEKIVSA